MLYKWWDEQWKHKELTRKYEIVLPTIWSVRHPLASLMFKHDNIWFFFRFHQVLQGKMTKVLINYADINKIVCCMHFACITIHSVMAVASCIASLRALCVPILWILPVKAIPIDKFYSKQSSNLLDCFDFEPNIMDSSRIEWLNFIVWFMYSFNIGSNKLQERYKFFSIHVFVLYA